uniref:Dehydrogenase/reductase SDR family member 11 n=10 Tax=Passeriformes TaxID=9126 RepID=A0A8C0V1F8_CYACU
PGEEATPSCDIGDCSPGALLVLVERPGTPSSELSVRSHPICWGMVRVLGWEGLGAGLGAALAVSPLTQDSLSFLFYSGWVCAACHGPKLAAECQSAGYPGTLIPYKCDLSNEEEILSMFSAIKTLHQGVDVCINNAGLARPEPLLSGKTEGWRTMIDVNVMAVSICTREAYQSMKERNIDDGHIININSMNGHSVVPQSVVHFYSATKYAVTALTEGLRQELREARTHIRATCISPGLVETGFAFKLHDNDPERAAATYESIRCLKAEDMANAVIYVLSAPPHVQIGDIQMRPTEQIS